MYSLSPGRALVFRNTPIMTFVSVGEMYRENGILGDISVRLRTLTPSSFRFHFFLFVYKIILILNFFLISSPGMKNIQNMTA